MFKHIFLVVLLAGFIGACGNSGILKTKTDDNESDLFDFSMVPSQFQKAASDQDLNDVEAISDIIGFLGSNIAKSRSMAELRDLGRLKKKQKESEYDDIYTELRNALSLCKVENTTKTVGTVTLIAYNFRPEVKKDLEENDEDPKECQFNLGGSFKDMSSVLGGGRNAPSISKVTDSFTLESKITYGGSIKKITYSYNTKVFELKKPDHNETSKTEEQTSLSGKIIFKSGAEVIFGLKKAKQDVKTKITDSRNNSSMTSDFRAGFKIVDDIVLYRDYSQKLVGLDVKDTEYKSINGLKVEEIVNENGQVEIGPIVREITPDSEEEVVPDVDEEVVPEPEEEVVPDVEEPPAEEAPEEETQPEIVNPEGQDDESGMPPATEDPEEN